MVEGERQLWCAVIEQALADVSRPMVPNKLERFEQIRARDWFLRASPDFKRVCSLAGMEWDRVRSVAIERIEAVRPDDTLIQHQRIPLQRRRRRAKLYEHDGRLLTVDQWAAKTGISTSTIRARLKSGMTIAEVITTPLYAKQRQGGAVVDNFAESPSDQTLPSTQAMMNIGFADADS